jgi:hypothetical protein
MHVPLLSFLVRKYRLSWFKFDLLLRSNGIFACVMKVHRHDVDDGLIASSVPLSAIVTVVRHHQGWKCHRTLVVSWIRVCTFAYVMASTVAVSTHGK